MYSKWEIRRRLDLDALAACTGGVSAGHSTTSAPDRSHSAASRSHMPGNNRGSTAVQEIRVSGSCPRRAARCVQAIGGRVVSGSLAKRNTDCGSCEPWRALHAGSHRESVRLKLPSLRMLLPTKENPCQGIGWEAADRKREPSGAILKLYPEKCGRCGTLWFVAN